MGSVYRRLKHFCVTCNNKRLDRTADRESCTAAGHVIKDVKSTHYWIKYSRSGKSFNESSGFTREQDAKGLLRKREGDIEAGRPVTPQVGKMSFEEGAADLLADYTANDKKSYAVVERRIRKHLTPFFERRRMANITTSDVRAYTVQRQTQNTVLVKKAQEAKVKKFRRPVRQPDGSMAVPPDRYTPAVVEQRRSASNAEINRELALLKRMFTLAMQAAKLLYRPHIPMVKENNPRTGFFEREQFESVMAHLPAEIQPVIEFAYITGWRIASEVLPLQWRQVDFSGGEIRLDAGTTKNGDGRVFPFTTGLRALLTAQYAEHERLKKAGQIEPWVFFRMVADYRRGPKKPLPIVSFFKAWKKACTAAGCPGRIPHDLRRTAIRNFVRTGTSETVAMMLSGHKTRSVFDRYNIVSGDDLRAAARRMDAATPAARQA